MALKFCDGFDHYAPDNTQGPTLQPYLEAAGYTVTNASTSTLSVAAGRRSGAHALKFSVARNTSNNATLAWTLHSESPQVCFGFAFNASGARMRICRIDDLLDLDWDPITGKMKVGDELGANILILNAWYYFEIAIDKLENTISVWANNEWQLTVPLATTPTDNYTLIWGQQGTALAAGTQLLDDFYALDGSGTQNTARLQPIEITSRMPDGDVTTQWDNSLGNKPHCQTASQLLPGEAGKGYLQSNVAGATDLFRSGTALPTANKVFGVSLLAYARKGDLDNRNLGLLIQTAGEATKEVQVPLTESFQYYQTVYEQTSGGHAWTQANVESLQFGLVTR